MDTNMKEIICPHCKKAFKVDEAGFADIVKQVRDHQFENDLSEGMQIAEREKEHAVELTKSHLKNLLQKHLVKKDQEISELRSQNEQQLAKLVSLKEAEIAEMKSKIEKAEVETKLTVTEATKLIEKERDDLMNQLKAKETETQLLEKSLQEKFTEQLKSKDDIIKMKDDEIAYRKDMKLKLSTKMIGETLEQHCEVEFNKLRATAF